jgi:hypothetical protein
MHRSTILRREGLAAMLTLMPTLVSAPAPFEMERVTVWSLRGRFMV